MGRADRRRPAGIHVESKPHHVRAALEGRLLSSRLRLLRASPLPLYSFSRGSLTQLHHRFTVSACSIFSICCRISSRLSFDKPRKRNSSLSSPYVLRSPTASPSSLISNRCA